MKGKRYQPRYDLHGPDKPLWARLIRASRLHYDMSQGDLADVSGVNSTNVGRADSGRNRPDPLNAPRLRQALSIPVEVWDAAMIGEPAPVEAFLATLTRADGPGAGSVDLTTVVGDAADQAQESGEP